MHYITFFAFFTVAASLPTFSPTLSRQSIFKHTQASEEEHQYPPYHDPRLLGGRLLDYTTEDDLGEPLNVIISSHSDPFILTDKGLETYSLSLGFDKECLGMHVGHLHDADLGDGAGRKKEEYLFRQSYFPRWGTCWESAVGGNHFRAWRQDGDDAYSGAWFLGVSKEKDGSKNHGIIPDGYNIGRNLLVEKATAGTFYKGKWWQADVEWKSGLLEPGSEGVNHEIEQDGLVAVLTVRRL